MNEELSVLYQAKAKDLRAHLKSWEGDWARSHDGNKPGRQDIKNNPDIGRPAFLADMAMKQQLTAFIQPRNIRNTAGSAKSSPARPLRQRPASRGP